jgi:hypothetical protein
MNERLKERIAEEWAMLDPVDPLRGLLSDVIDALAQPDYRPVKTYHEGKPVYVSQPAQEPDELTIAYMSGLYDGKKKRPWVGLTDEEIDACWNNLFGPGNYNRRNVYQAIEAALRSKNT